MWQTYSNIENVTYNLRGDYWLKTHDWINAYVYFYFTVILIKKNNTLTSDEHLFLFIMECTVRGELFNPRDFMA